MKLAFLGAGRVVEWQLERFKLYEKLKVVGFYDIDKKSSEILVKKGYYSFSSLKELASSKADVIIISTPSHEHFSSLISLLKENIKDKIITIEKPTFLKQNDFSLIEKEIEKKSLKILPIFQNRYNYAVQETKKYIKNGDIGEIMNGRIILSWCRPQRYYDQAEWRGKWLSDGGALTNQGIHFIDVARYLMGEVQNVSFRMDRANIDIECENVAMGTLKLRNGRLINVDISTTSRPNDHFSEISIYGTKGFISLGGLALNKIKDSSLGLKSDFYEEIPNGYGYGHEKFYLEISKYFDNYSSPHILSDLNDAKNTSAILNAAYTSANKGGKVVSTEGPFEEILGYDLKNKVNFF